MTTDGSHRQLTRNIMSVYRQASPEQIRLGLAWYDMAFTEVERIAFWATRKVDLTRATICLAHLSPRARWDRNRELLAIMLSDGNRPDDVLTRSWEKAWVSLRAVNPWLTFGGSARKTRAFAQAILGDPHAVPIDVWAARVAGADDRLVKGARGYVAVAEAYRRAAKIARIQPRQIQATTWIVTRGDHQ